MNSSGRSDGEDGVGVGFRVTFSTETFRTQNDRKIFFLKHLRLLADILNSNRLMVRGLVVSKKTRSPIMFTLLLMKQKKEINAPSEKRNN